MLRLLSLLLPALMPSWSFFKTVEASPRVEFRLDGGEWREARPRPERITLARQLRRMLWNPRWNEALYMVSLSERLIIEPSAHSRDTLTALIAKHAGGVGDSLLQFRIAFVDRAGDRIVKTIEYESDPVRLRDVRP